MALPDLLLRFKTLRGGLGYLFFLYYTNHSRLWECGACNRYCVNTDFDRIFYGEGLYGGVHFAIGRTLRG